MSKLTTHSTSERPTTGGTRSQEPMYERLGVLPWDDARDVSETGHDPRSAYVETFWLPIIGPSSTLLLRRLADEFDHSPDGFELDCAGTSREIGLGPRLHRRAPFFRTIDRCEKFGLVQFDGGLLYVRQRLPEVRSAQLARLPDRLRQLHATWTLPRDDDGPTRRTELNRATHLSRTLFALGESEHAIERQLHQWHFHPSIAWHAVQLAQTGGDGDGDTGPTAAVA